ncbi:N-acetylglucosaminyl-phosphatidylinositol de-N-acetylase [Rhizina undulata]
MDWTTALSLPVAIVVIWFYTLVFARGNSIALPTNTRITLLIAHPDDEAMFFSPTLLALTKPELENEVKVLCFSSGNADGLGEVRKKELVKSCLQLGVKNASDVTILEHSALQDSMTSAWPTTTIVSQLSALNPQPSIFLTFDSSGVSSHPNHIALYHGAKAFLKKNAKEKGRYLLYTLKTVGIHRKYLWILDAPITLMGLFFGEKMREGAPTALLFVSSPRGLRKAVRAMTVGHESQMRWFRWGWIGISRYMVINDLRLEKN